MDEKLKKRIEKTRREATERVNKEALVQFRIEAHVLDALWAEANKRCLPVGVLARMWVLERLQQEQSA